MWLSSVLEAVLCYAGSGKSTANASHGVSHCQESCQPLSGVMPAMVVVVVVAKLEARLEAGWRQAGERSCKDLHLLPRRLLVLWVLTVAQLVC